MSRMGEFRERRERNRRMVRSLKERGFSYEQIGALAGRSSSTVRSWEDESGATMTPLSWVFSQSDDELRRLLWLIDRIRPGTRVRVRGVGYDYFFDDEVVSANPLDGGMDGRRITLKGEGVIALSRVVGVTPEEPLGRQSVQGDGRLRGASSDMQEFVEWAAISALPGCMSRGGVSTKAAAKEAADVAIALWVELHGGAPVEEEWRPV